MNYQLLSADVTTITKAVTAAALSSGFFSYSAAVETEMIAASDLAMAASSAVIATITTTAAVL